MSVLKRHSAVRGIQSIAAFAAAALFLIPAIRGPAQEPPPARVFLQASSTAPQVGQRITVEVRIDTADQPVAVAGIFLQFNPERLRFNSGTVNTAAFNNGLFTSVPAMAETGIVSFSAAAAETVSGTNLLLATLSFSAVSNGLTPLTLLTDAPRESILQDVDLNDLPTTVEKIEVSIRPLPSAVLRIEPAIREASNSNPAAVEIRLDTQGLPVRLLEAYLSFDADALRWDSGHVNRNIFDDSSLTASPREIAPGMIALRAASLDPVVGDNFHVATLSFLPLRDGMAPLDFLAQAPIRTRAADSNFADLSLITRGGLLAVRQERVARLSLSPATENAARGQEIELALKLEALRCNPRFLEVFVEYDTFHLRFEGGAVNRQVFDNRAATSEPDEPEDGLISFLAGSTRDLPDGETLVATLRFTALSKGEAEVQFHQQAPRDTKVMDVSISPLPLAAQGAHVSIGNVDVARLFVFPPVREVQRADFVDAQVHLADATDLRLIRSFLHFDSARLRFLYGSINSEVFNHAMYSSPPRLQAPGVVSFSAGALAPVAGDALVATLRFQALAEGISDLEFLNEPPTQTSVQREGFLDLPFTTQDGTVTILTPPQQLYTFGGDAENWTFHSTSAFDAPLGQALPGDPGALLLQAQGSAQTFGYFESPVLGSFALPSGTLASAGVPFWPDDFLTAEFFLRSGVADRARVPQFRLRATAEDLQQSALAIVDSRSDGAASPGPEGRSYMLVFSPMPGTGAFTLSFDFLNFDAGDDPYGDLRLDWVDVRAHRATQLINRKTVFVYEFENDQEGWQTAATDVYAQPEFAWSPGALTLSPAGQDGVFGFWYSPGADVPVEPGRIYVATFEVESDVAAADRARVPSFRCRLNESGLHSGAYMAVESRATASRSPVAGEPQMYTVYFLPPYAEGAPALISAFDLLHFDPQDAANATLHLNRLTLESATPGW